MRSVVIIEERESRGALSVFCSIEEAVSQLEVIDVENGEFDAFDAEGFPLTLSIDGGRVKIERTSGTPSKKEAVETMLRRFVGKSESSMSYDQLIVAAEKRSRGWLSRLIHFCGAQKMPNQALEPTAPSGRGSS